jgi:hypothetical protein
MLWCLFNAVNGVWLRLLNHTRNTMSEADNVVLPLTVMILCWSVQKEVISWHRCVVVSDLPVGIGERAYTLRYYVLRIKGNSTSCNLFRNISLQRLKGANPIKPATRVINSSNFICRTAINERLGACHYWTLNKESDSTHIPTLLQNKLLQTLCCGIKLYRDSLIYNPLQFIAWNNVQNLSVNGDKTEWYWS